MERPDWVPPEVDPHLPSVARIYDYFLGGSHNFAADRELARQTIAAMPDVAMFARINRAFLRRAVRTLLDAGVRQFLDIGSGIPTVGSVHEIAQQVDPRTRVVYVDLDPVAVAHSQALLADNPAAIAVRADARNPSTITDNPDIRRMLDFTQPVAVLLVAVLHYLDDASAAAVVDRVKDLLGPGGYLVMSHGTSDGLPPEAVARILELSRRTPTVLVNRDRATIERFFDGLELIEPGLVWVSQWRPEDAEDETPARSGSWAAVGRKP